MRCKEQLKKEILTLRKYFKGPFFLGEEFSQGDVLMAPYFDRLCVLKHYREFEIP
jgi:glutathione S-transferase